MFICSVAQMLFVNMDSEFHHSVGAEQITSLFLTFMTSVNSCCQIYRSKKGRISRRLSVSSRLTSVLIIFIFLVGQKNREIYQFSFNKAGDSA